jgi:TRAP-type C4-dicarboxylate transport system substrate-binding protein
MRLGIRCLVLATAVMVSLAAEAQEVKGPKVNWNISVWGNKRAFTAGMELIAAEVAKKTGGAFTIKVVYGSVLSPERENLDNIKIGSLEGAFFCSGYHPGKNPGMTVLDLPFLPIGDLNVAQTVAEAVYHHPFIVAEMKKWDAFPFMAALLPQYEFMGVGSPPLKLEDWKGKRVRALGGLGDAMRALGATPTSVTAPELYTSLDRGTVDAASLPFSYALASYKLHEISKWYTANMAPGANNCGVALSLTALGKIPAQYRSLLDGLKAPAYEALKKAYKEADDKNIPIFNKTLKPVSYSDAELARFHTIGGKPVWDKWVNESSGKGVPAKELLELVMTTAQKSKAK